MKKVKQFAILFLIYFIIIFQNDKVKILLYSGFQNKKQKNFITSKITNITVTLLLYK